MTSKTKLATLVAASSFVFASAVAPAMAASAMTSGFISNVQPNVDFLDSSSRLALTHSNRARVRAFAHREAMDQTITANSLVAYETTNTPVVVGAVVGGPLAPVVGLATVPLDVAANVTTSVGTNVDNVLTGRSVAIDNPLGSLAPVAPRPVGPVSLLPAERADLDRLSAMSGPAFDALYRSTQMDALRQLATLYSDYIQNGDDDALRGMARRELPKINRDIRELNAL